MTLDRIASKIDDLADVIDYIDLLLYNRPLPHREYDQIYMKARHMLIQATYVHRHLFGRKIAFLGDGDGMSLLLALLSQKHSLGINSMTIFDFDERILHAFESVALSHHGLIPTFYQLYNIIEPIAPNYKSQFDFFYINPPYGSKNDGLSCIMWLMRCMEFTTVGAEGCIIIPNDERYTWACNCMKNIKSFLDNNGFQILNVVNNIHQYHLADNPKLLSSMLHVKRTSDCKSPYEGARFPISMCTNLYGSTRAIPKYIYISADNPYGNPDFNWEYGHIENFPVTDKGNRE